MLILNDENFDSHTSGPLLVMFKADFAGPSLMAEPTFDHVKSLLKGEVPMGKFDLEGNPDTPAKYAVKQIPLFVLFVDGRIMDAVAGAVPADRIVRLLDDL